MSRSRNVKLLSNYPITIVLNKFLWRPTGTFFTDWLGIVKEINNVYYNDLPETVWVADCQCRIEQRVIVANLDIDADGPAIEIDDSVGHLVTEASKGTQEQNQPYNPEIGNNMKPDS
jgi:hypothetical protein